MKKIYSFILLLMGALCSAVAQDTIYDSQLDGPYMMPTRCYPKDGVHAIPIPDHPHCKFEYFGQFHTNSSISVYGIAFTAFLEAYHLFPDSMDIKYYMGYTSIGSSMMGRLDNDIDFSYVDSVSMSPNTYPTTYFSYTHYDNNTTDVVHSVFPCYELYFDTLHKVADTFYVGFSVDNHSILEPSAFAFQSHFYEMINIAAFIINEEPQITVFKEFNYGVDDTAISVVNGHWGGIFPILQPDRPYCNPVGGLRVVERGQDYATLCWDNAGDSVYYQLVFGDDAANPIFTYDTCYTRTGLDSGIFYNAHLRRVCHHDCPYHPDSTLYSPWSPGVEFYLGSTNPDDIGIEHQPSVDFSIYPNPTAGQFSLSLPEGMEARVFIGDADGRSVYDQKATGSVMHFDLSALPTGNYTVTIDTPLGPGTKQLSIIK